MKVHSISSLAVALAAVALPSGLAAQDAACSSACPASAPTACQSTLDDGVATTAAPPALALLASLQVDDPPRLGVYIDITDDGITVDSVIEKSLAEAAGVQSGDVIFRVNGARIESADDVAAALAETPAGGKVNLTVIRPGEGLVGLTASTAKPKPKPEPKLEIRRGGGAGGNFFERKPDASAAGFQGGFLGVTLGESDSGGVSVESIVPASSAWYAGIDDGDVIVAIDGKSVSDPDDVVSAISSRKAGEFVKIEIKREGETQKLRARLGQRGPAGPFGLQPNGQGMRWFQPDEGIFEFDGNAPFPKGLRFNTEKLGDGQVFEWKSDDGKAKRFLFKSDGEDIEFDGDIKALIEKAGGQGGAFHFKHDGDGLHLDGDVETIIEKAKGDGGNAWIIESDDGKKGAKKVIRIGKGKGGDSGALHFKHDGDGPHEHADIEAIIKKIGSGNGHSWIFGGDGDVEIEGDIKAIIEKAMSADKNVIRLGKTDSTSGTIDRLLRGHADAGDIKTSTLKIIIDGDDVTVDRDGNVETMTLDELGDIEGLELHMHDGSSLHEWTHGHDGADVDVHVDVHEDHDLKKSTGSDV